MIEYKTDAVGVTTTILPEIAVAEAVTEHLKWHAKNGWRLVGQSGGDSVVYVTMEKVTEPSGLAPA